MRKLFRLRFLSDRDRRLAAVAPGVLCLVAGAHLAAVAGGELSAWKGGGFGMFSTVDAPHARFLRVFLITPDGELPILVPPRWDVEVRKLRAMPTARRLRRLGQDLLARPWTRYEIVSAAERYRGALGGEEEDAPPSPGSPPRLGGPGPVRLDMTPFGFVRPQGEDADGRPPLDAIAVLAVRLEVWRYRFASEEEGLRAEMLRRTTCERPR